MSRTSVIFYVRKSEEQITEPRSFGKKLRKNLKQKLMVTCMFLFLILHSNRIYIFITSLRKTYTETDAITIVNVRKKSGPFQKKAHGPL